MLERRYFIPCFASLPMAAAALRRLLPCAPLLAAFGASACGDSEKKPWSPMMPLLVAAEDGQLGANVMRLTDATDPSITYVTASVNDTVAPLDLSDPRVSSQPLTFPAGGQWQIYARVRIGPDGPTDDSLFINTGTDAAPSWQTANDIAGLDVAGSPRHQPGAIVGDLGGSNSPDTWKWALLPVRLTVPDGELARTFSFATREDGLHIDGFAFALVGADYTVGFTTTQLDTGQAGESVPNPVLPPAYEPPANQPPLVVGSSKYLHTMPTLPMARLIRTELASHGVSYKGRASTTWLCCERSRSRPTRVGSSWSSRSLPAPIRRASTSMSTRS